MAMIFPLTGNIFAVNFILDAAVHVYNNDYIFYVYQKLLTLFTGLSTEKTEIHKNFRYF